MLSKLKESLEIKGANDSPYVNFDIKNGLLLMGGSSLPENPAEFFSPIIKWLDEYKAQPHPKTKIEFFFEYLNTASSNMVMRIIEIINEIKNACDELAVNWCFISGDYDMRDMGHEMFDDLSMEYNLVEKEEFIEF